MFLCVVVTKGAQFDQYDWPRRLYNQVSIYNIDTHDESYNIGVGFYNEKNNDRHYTPHSFSNFKL